MTNTDPRLLLLSPNDDVLVVRARIRSEETIWVEGRQVRIADDLPLGHKVARHAIPAGRRVLKYGAPIGVATRNIEPGMHVHVHNIRSDYTPTFTLDGAKTSAGGRGS